jgi:hypothetical protein
MSHAAPCDGSDEELGRGRRPPGSLIDDCDELAMEGLELLEESDELLEDEEPTTVTLMITSSVADPRKIVFNVPHAIVTASTRSTGRTPVCLADCDKGVCLEGIEKLYLKMLFSSILWSLTDAIYSLKNIYQTLFN